MAEQGHGNHWECIDDMDKVFQNTLPRILQAKYYSIYLMK